MATQNTKHIFQTEANIFPHIISSYAMLLTYIATNTEKIGEALNISCTFHQG